MFVKACKIYLKKKKHTYYLHFQASFSTIENSSLMAYKDAENIIFFIYDFEMDLIIFIF